MKYSWLAVIAAPIIAVMFAAPAAHALLPLCTPIPETSFEIDGISGLTAAVVNPGSLNGVSIVATGCDIGVYFSPGTTGSVTNSTVTGAQKAGIVNNGGKVTIDSNSVYQIGDNPLDGVQYGLAIYVYGFNSRASGNVTNNTVWNFQKNGITLRGPTSNIKVQGNTVIGQGPVNYIAQNGIEIGLGASTSVQSNTVSGMSYTGTNSAASAGILLFGGHCYDGFITPSAAVQSNTSVTSNNVTASDVGIWLNNLAADCVSSDSRTTRNNVSLNSARNNGIFNKTGGPLTSLSPSDPYQAGISDQGRSDSIIGNSICGIGYTPQASTPPYLFSVDTTLAISPLALLNFCF
jgi:hypothetical protein